MQVLRVKNAGTDYQYKWPDNMIELYPTWITYDVVTEDGEHEAKIAFGNRKVYGSERIRVLVLIDEYPQAEFLGTDDNHVSGQVLSEIKIHGDVGEPMCRYPEDPIPGRYMGFDVVGMPTRVSGKGVHNAWAVVANISDHRTMIALAILRREERTS
jgi:hypothetical protein